MLWNSSKHSTGIQQEDQAAIAPSVQPLHWGLRALRRTNRFFDKLCQPFLFRELGLLSDLKLARLKRIDDIIPIPRWTFVQSISVFMDPNPTFLNRNGRVALGPFIDHAMRVAYILEKCRNLKALALYYRHRNVQMLYIRDVLLSLLNEGQLSALGFYSMHLLHDKKDQIDHTGEVAGLIDLLEIIAQYEPAQQSLRTLDVVADWIPGRIFDLIRSQFTGLTSLTLRRVVGEPWYTSKVWDVDQQPKWHAYPNLTSLELRGFQPGHSAHIPFLVRHFIALKELKISACGGEFIGEINWRPRNWSRAADALCNNHSTLTTFRIEHMADWEIYELGVIPTSTLLVTTVGWRSLLAVLRTDYELFPGLRILRVASPHSPLSNVTAAEVENPADGKPSMQAVCEDRNVELR